MYAIGHFAIGYLIAKPFAMKLRKPLDMPLLLSISVIADVDLLTGLHRGPTHSLVIVAALIIPFLIYFRQTAIPYSVAFASHSIGDLPEGAQFFWPLSTERYGILNVDVESTSVAVLELILFVVSIALMLQTRDLQRMFVSNHRPLLLLPFVAVLGPMLGVGGGIGLGFSTLLVIPSLIYLALFAYSLVAKFQNIHRKKSWHKNQRNEKPFQVVIIEHE
jgi:membrane-bound metal-dependent hydrolase YbcI (DUF457 family)